MSSRPRVTHLITTLNIGGSEMMLYRLLRGMDAERFEHRVISLVPPGDVGDLIAGLGIRVATLNMQHGRPSVRAFQKLIFWLREDPPDILQTWLYHADLMGLAAGKLAGVKHILWNVRSSNMDMSQYRRLSSWTVRACSRLAALPEAVLVNSRAGLRYHQKIGYRPRRWALIPNGVDTKKFAPDPAARQMVRAELGLETDAFLIGYVARFDPMKDHATFLRAARCLVDTYPEVRFLFCGSEMAWENGVLSAMVDELELRPWLHLLGPRRDIPRVMAALDVAASSSMSEGFPNTLVEAMSCGVPCVATAAGDTIDILAKTGIIVQPGDAPGLAEAWAAMIAMPPEDRRQLGQAARERVLAHFSLRRMVSAYERLYEEIVA